MQFQSLGPGGGKCEGLVISTYFNYNYLLFFENDPGSLSQVTHSLGFSWIEAWDLSVGIILHSSFSRPCRPLQCLWPLSLVSAYPDGGFIVETSVMSKGLRFFAGVDGEFHRWEIPNSWLVYNGQSHENG